MTPKRLLLLLSAWCLLPAAALAQSGGSDLDVFGYFQASLYRQKDLRTGTKLNSFTLQQLNLILEKELWQRWNTFVNFEFTNSYSSFDNWGSFSLEEAWVRYRQSRYFRLKVGLLIPRFNSLNVIKNRTPLLPYIIRPLVYETSFQQSLPIEEFVPEQAYIQVHGSAPIGGDVKLDYTGYWGNSPNIATDPESANTGLDTTSSFLFGMRVGLRHPNFKVGISTTADKTNQFVGLEEAYNKPPGSFEQVPRYRTGFDFSVEWRSLEFWSEAIGVFYDDDEPDLDVDKSFFYMTVAYTFWERLLVYFGYMELKSNLTILVSPGAGESPISELTSKVPNFGVSFALNDRLKLKAQFANGETTTVPPGVVEESFDFLAIAASVWF
jgi:hypothetical protein